MKHAAPLLILLALTVITSCTHSDDPAKRQPVKIRWGIAIHTIEAKQDTLGEEVGVCVGNKALSYTIDTATAQALAQQQYLVRDCPTDGPAVWVKQDSTFIRTPVSCGYSNGKRTIITSGLSGGEELVTSIRVSTTQ